MSVCGHIHGFACKLGTCAVGSSTVNVVIGLPLMGNLVSVDEYNQHRNQTDERHQHRRAQSCIDVRDEAPRKRQTEMWVFCFRLCRKKQSVHIMLKRIKRTSSSKVSSKKLKHITCLNCSTFKFYKQDLVQPLSLPKTNSVLIQQQLCLQQHNGYVLKSFEPCSYSEITSEVRVAKKRFSSWGMEEHSNEQTTRFSCLLIWKGDECGVVMWVHLLILPDRQRRNFKLYFGTKLNFRLKTNNKKSKGSLCLEKVEFFIKSYLYYLSIGVSQYELGIFHCLSLYLLFSWEISAVPAPASAQSCFFTIKENWVTNFSLGKSTSSYKL